MKLFRMLEDLQKSTRLTVLGCACFLAATALIIVFLMFFPITPSDKHVVTISRLTSENDAEQTYPAIEFNWDDVQHTLSTWSAGVDGFSRSLDDFTTTEPEETTVSDTVTAVTETYEVVSDVTEVSENADETLNIPPMPQTTTETVRIDDPELPTEQTDPPPVITEPVTVPAQEPEDE